MPNKRRNSRRAWGGAGRGVGRWGLGGCERRLWWEAGLGCGAGYYRSSKDTAAVEWGGWYK